MKTLHVNDKNDIMTCLSDGDDVRLISENGKCIYLTAKKEPHTICAGCVFKDRHSEAYRTIGSCIRLNMSCIGVILVDTRAIMEEL